MDLRDSSGSRFSMYSWCIPRWPGAGMSRSSVCFMLSSRLLTSLLVLLLRAVGDALLSPAVGFALVLPAVGYALLILFHHLSSAYSDSVLRLSSPIVRRLSSTSCCVRQSGVASFLLLVTTDAVSHGSFCSLSELTRCLRAARSSSVTLWSFTTPWFVSGFLQHHHSAFCHFVVVGSR